MFTQAGRPWFFGGGPAGVFHGLAAASLLVLALNLRFRLRRRAIGPAAGGRPWLLPLGDGPGANGPWEAALLGAARLSLLTLALGSLLGNLHLHLGPFLRGRIYIVYALALDLAGGLLLLAVLGLLARRPWRAPGGGASLASLGLLLWVGLSGLGAEYARLAATRPDWAWAEFLGWLPARLWSWGGPSDAWLSLIWWAHVLPALLLVAWLPRLRL
jgi:hypothetical protein